MYATTTHRTLFWRDSKREGRDESQHQLMMVLIAPSSAG
jgi:hypothetical protein